MDSDNIMGDGDPSGDPVVVVENPTSMVTEEEGTKLVVDGLLCCIVKALSRSANHSELITAVDRDSNEVDQTL